MQNLVHKMKCFNCGREFRISVGIDVYGRFVNAYFCPNCKSFHSFPSEKENQKFYCPSCKNLLEKIKFFPSEFANGSDSIEETLDYIQEITKHGQYETTEPIICCPNCKNYNLTFFVDGVW